MEEKYSENEYTIEIETFIDSKLNKKIIKNKFNNELLHEFEYFENGNLKSEINYVDEESYTCENFIFSLFGWKIYRNYGTKIAKFEYYDSNNQIKKSEIIYKKMIYYAESQELKCQTFYSEYYLSGKIKYKRKINYNAGINDNYRGFGFPSDFKIYTNIRKLTQEPEYFYYDNKNNSIEKIIEENNILYYDENKKLVKKDFYENSKIIATINY